MLLQKRVSSDHQLSSYFVKGNADVMALLVTAPGANLAEKDKDGKTAEQLARYSSN